MFQKDGGNSIAGNNNLARLYETFLNDEDLPSNDHSDKMRPIQINHKRSKSSTLTDDDNQLVPLLNRLLVLIEDQKDKRITLKQQSKESHYVQKKSQLEIIPERPSLNKQKSFIFTKKRYSEDNKKRQCIYLPSFSTSNQSRPESSVTQTNLLMRGPTYSRNGFSLHDNLYQTISPNLNSTMERAAKSFAVTTLQQNNNNLQSQTVEHLQSRNYSNQLPALQKTYQQTDSSSNTKQPNKFFPPPPRVQRKTIEQILFKQSGGGCSNQTKTNFSAANGLPRQNQNVMNEFSKQRQEIKEILTKTTDKILDSSFSLQNNIIAGCSPPRRYSNSILDFSSDQNYQNFQRPELPLLSSYIVRTNHPLTVSNKLNRELFNFSEDTKLEGPKTLIKTPSRLVLNKSQIKFKQQQPQQEIQNFKPQLTIEIPHDEASSRPFTPQSNASIPTPIQQIEELTLMKVILNIVSRQKVTSTKQQNEVQVIHHQELSPGKVTRGIQYESQDFPKIDASMFKQQESLQSDSQNLPQEKIKPIVENVKSTSTSVDLKFKPEMLSTSSQITSSQYSKDQMEESRNSNYNSQCQMQSSGESTPPAIIKIRNEQNEKSGNSPAKTQSPIKTMRHDPLQTVIETQESRDDQDLTESTPRLPFNQDRGYVKSETRMLKLSQQSLQKFETKNSLSSVQSKTSQSSQHSNVERKQPGWKRVSIILNSESFMRKSESLKNIKNITVEPIPDNLLDVPMIRKYTGLKTDSSFEQSVQSKSKLKQIEEANVDRSETVSFGHVTNHIEMFISESPINLIYSDSQNFAQTIIHSEVSQPFSSENQVNQRRGSAIQVIPPQNATSQKYLKRTLTPMLGNATNLSSSGQRKFSDYTKNKDNDTDILSPVAHSRQKFKSPQNTLVKQKTGLILKPPTNPSNALSKKSTTQSRQNSSIDVATGGSPRTKTQNRHLTKLKRKIVGF